MLARERERRDAEREAREVRADLRAGRIAAAVLNSQGGITPSEGAPARPATPYDFFPGLPSAPPERTQTPEEQIAMWKAMGARDLRERKEQADDG
ncbi:MAG: phage tail assembly protein T [Gemmatimonadota bacterium]